MEVRMKVPLTLAMVLASAVAWTQPLSPELEDVKGTIAGGGAEGGRVGYTIRVPKGAYLIHTGEWRDVYSSRYNSFVSFNVQVERSPVRTLEAALKDATPSGRNVKPEASAIEGGFQVVRRPTSDSVVDASVWTYKVGELGGVRAQCSGPAKAVDALVAMCATLQVVPVPASD
jgi:hypothetical protein